MKRKVYNYILQDKVDVQLPEQVKEAMHICGWNAFGVYELVATELRKEKREAKKSLKT